MTNYIIVCQNRYNDRSLRLMHLVQKSPPPPFLLMIYSASFDISLLEKNTWFQTRRSGQIHFTSKRKKINPVSGSRCDMSLTLDTETTWKVTAHLLTKGTLKVKYSQIGLTKEKICSGQVMSDGRTDGVVTKGRLQSGALIISSLKDL